MQYQPLNKKLRLNVPQLRSLLNPARIKVNIWGRGTGKTFDLGYTSVIIAYEMPKSLNVIVGRTMVHLLDITLQSLIASWTAQGYIENIHYVIRKRPPDNWPRAYNRPLRYDNVISWHTGAAFILASQESRFRGGNVDSIFLDEALEAKKDHFEDEIVAANRGNIHRFGGHPLHHSVHISTSMPHGKRGRWLLDFGNYYEEDNFRYDAIYRKIAKLQLELVDNWPHNLETCKKLFAEIQSAKNRIKYYVKDNVFYSQADSFDNLQNLTMEWFKDERRIMSELKFSIELLNLKPYKTEGGFYPDLDNEHLYNNGQTGFEEINNLPLSIACDYGGSFNCMVVAQPLQSIKQINFLHNFYKEHPGKINDVIDDFCKHYENRANREVHYYYDQTAIGTDGKDDLTYKDIVLNKLRQHKWIVYTHYMGKAPNHFKKYELWSKSFKGLENCLFPYLSKEGCKELIYSMEMSPIKGSRNSFEKDKSSENPKNAIPQHEATHLSDAADQLLWGAHYSNGIINAPFVG